MATVSPCSAAWGVAVGEVGGERARRDDRTVDEAVAERLTERQREAIDGLLVVRDGERVCDLERLRRSPSTVSGPGMVRALARIQELGDLSVEEHADVPARHLHE